MHDKELAALFVGLNQGSDKSSNKERTDTYSFVVTTQVHKATKGVTPEIIIDSTLIQATVKGLQCPYPNDCTEEIMVLKFNPSFKIVSVKAYYLK